MVYVYAVVPPETTLVGPIAGAWGDWIQITSEGPLGVAFGETEQVHRANRAELQAHDAAIRRLAERVPAVLPARFGGVAAEPADAVSALRPRAAALVDALARVRGKQQMTIRFYGPSPPAQAPPYAAESGPGGRYLAERRRAREANRAAAFDPVRARLCAWIAAERIELHASAPLLLSAHHLVDRRHLQPYRDGLAALSDTLSPHWIVLSGPWPAYAFAPEVS